MNSLSGSKGPTGKGGFSGDITPKGYRQGQIQQFTPDQMGLYQNMLGLVGQDSYLSKLARGDQSTFDQVEAPAYRQFNEQLSNIANRFSGGSGKGSLGVRGSQFQNANTAAASNFAQDLQSQRQGMMSNALRELMGFSNQLLQQRPYDRFLVEKQQKQNPWAEIGGRFAGAIPGAVASYFGSPGGAGASAQQLGTSNYAARQQPQNTSGPYNLPTFMGR